MSWIPLLTLPARNWGLVPHAHTSPPLQVSDKASFRTTAHLFFSREGEFSLSVGNFRLLFRGGGIVYTCCFFILSISLLLPLSLLFVPSSRGESSQDGRACVCTREICGHRR